MIPVKDKKLKVTKMGAVEGRGLGNFDIGEAHVGMAENNLEVGEGLVLSTRAGFFFTSTVRELLEGNKFKTNNSIYQYELMEEDPDQHGDEGGLGVGEPKRPNVPQRPGTRAEAITRPHGIGECGGWWDGTGW